MKRYKFPRVTEGKHKESKKQYRLRRGMVQLRSGRWVTQFDAFCIALAGGNPEEYMG